jgi:hypothetical protein
MSCAMTVRYKCRLTILQKGWIRAEYRRKAFTSCGFLDRYQGFGIIRNSGSVVLELMKRIDYLLAYFEMDWYEIK